MSQSDIYKNREAIPDRNKPPEKRRKRRSTSQRAFDDRPRARRSKNTGLRRLLHLSRKSSNEKFFWSMLGSVFVVVLVVIALWQFVILEHFIRSEEKKDDYLEEQSRIPERAEAASESATE